MSSATTTNGSDGGESILDGKGASLDGGGGGGPHEIGEGFGSMDSSDDAIDLADEVSVLDLDAPANGSSTDAEEQLLPPRKMTRREREGGEDEEYYFQHEWPLHKKHIFILSNSGKPVYSRSVPPPPQSRLHARLFYTIRPRHDLSRYTRFESLHEHLDSRIGGLFFAQRVAAATLAGMAMNRSYARSCPCCLPSRRLSMQPATPSSAQSVSSSIYLKTPR
jgi:hypothetical protein